MASASCITKVNPTQPHGGNAWSSLGFHPSNPPALHLLFSETSEKHHDDQHLGYLQGDEVDQWHRNKCAKPYSTYPGCPPQRYQIKSYQIKSDHLILY